MVRAATDQDRTIWRSGRRRSFVAKVVHGVWGLVQAIAVLVGGGGPDIEDDVAHTDTGPGAFPAKVLAGTLEGEPKGRLLVEGSSMFELRKVVLAGTLSFPPDGMVWQPERTADRGILIPNESVEAVVTGLPGHGVLFHVVDGRLGLTLRRKDFDHVEAQLRARYGGEAASERP